MITEYPSLGNMSPLIFSEKTKLDFLLSLLDRKFYIWHTWPITFKDGQPPLCNCWRGAECKNPGKCPIGKWSKALDPNLPSTRQLVIDIVERFPDRGWFVDLGKSGLIGVDIDPKNGGFESLAKMRSMGILAGREPDVITGSGGYHFYDPVPANVDRIRGWIGLNGETRCHIKPFPGVDCKTGQAYFMLPGTMHKNGNRYFGSIPENMWPMSPALVEMWNSQPAFAAKPSPALKAYVDFSHAGGFASEGSLEQARKYVAKMDPPTHDGTHSKKACKVARVGWVDFGLDRADTRELVAWWSRQCGETLPAAEIERILDYAERGNGMRGWRNNLRGGRLTKEERELLDANKDFDAYWDVPVLERKIENAEIFQADPKTDVDCQCQAEFGQTVGKPHDDGLQPEEVAGRQARPQCQHWVYRIFSHVRTSDHCVKCFRCWSTLCPGCMPLKRELYADTVSHWLFRRHASYGKREVPNLWVANVPRDDVDAMIHRIRNQGGKFFSVEFGGLGNIPGPECQIVSTVHPSGPYWRDVGTQEAVDLLRAACAAIPLGCRGKVFRKSNCWKLLSYNEKPTGEWKLDGKPAESLKTSEEILARRDIEARTINSHPKSSVITGIIFNVDPNDWPSVKADLEAGFCLADDVEFVSGSTNGDVPVIPEWEREFMSG